LINPARFLIGHYGSGAAVLARAVIRLCCSGWRIGSGFRIAIPISPGLLSVSSAERMRLVRALKPGMGLMCYAESPLPIPEPAGAPRRDDEIDVAAAALRADGPAAPDIQIQIGTVPLRLLGGVEIGDAMAVVAPDAQQEVRPGRGAERRRTSVAFEAFPSHIPDTMQPDLSPEDYAAIAALLRDTIAADRFPLFPRVRGL